MQMPFDVIMEAGIHFLVFPSFPFPLEKTEKANIDRGYLLQILAHFHPMDLYHLGRTTTYFRGLLISSQNTLSLDLWKSSFQNSEVPINPRDMTPVKWASLLFGRDLCYVRLSPAPGIPKKTLTNKPDVVLQQRRRVHRLRTPASCM